jgi:uncharacterized protein YegP (UPF0339 family)
MNVRVAASRPSAFEKLRTQDGHYFFRILGKAGTAISVSRLFDAEKSCTHFMEHVKTSIAKASMTEY